METKLYQDCGGYAVLIRLYMSDSDIIKLAEERGIEFDPFCLVNFVKEKLSSNIPIDDILDMYEDLDG